MKRQFAPSWLFQATEYAYADTENNVCSWKFHSLYLKSHVVYSKKIQYFSGSFLATTTNLFQIDAIIALEIYKKIEKLSKLQDCNCTLSVQSFAGM